MTAPREKGSLLTALAVCGSLSAGCLLEANPPTGGVDIYWTFQSPTMGEIGDVLTDGATTICSEAAVRDVRVTLWRAVPAGEVLEPSTRPCIGHGDVPGAGFDGLEPGTWGYYLEGRRGGVTVFEASGEVEVVDGERTLEDVRAAPVSGSWDVVVDYTTSGCAASDRLRFDLVDTATLHTTYSTDDAGLNPHVVVPCAHTLPFTIPAVAPGTYRFSDWVHVDAAGAAKSYGACRPAWIQHDSASTSLSVDVTAAEPPPAGNLGICP